MRSGHMPLISIEQAIQDIKAGKMVILVDDEDRENEGDLTMAAQFVTPEAINFMAKHGRGLICLSMSGDHVRRPGSSADGGQQPEPSSGPGSPCPWKPAAGLPPVFPRPTGPTPFRRPSRPMPKPSDLVRPGHIFPLRARKGGVTVRTGQTEGSVDLARLAGLRPAGGHLRDHG